MTTLRKAPTAANKPAVTVRLWSSRSPATVSIAPEKNWYLNEYPMKSQEKRIGSRSPNGVASWLSEGNGHLKAKSLMMPIPGATNGRKLRAIRPRQFPNRVEIGRFRSAMAQTKETRAATSMYIHIAVHAHDVSP